ncbi:hypothetical protein TELCIR_04423 [Teladorsagia circumcincta]|uniref:Uncharacterized protein n=1 Tax=Teladorsagia circumcincta TaxID=45464 RepID=A0A2G9UTP2_TELCI|nr:hypothetical protein TELCIR_04423 [Teladorsagia circumcincta]
MMVARVVTGFGAGTLSVLRAYAATASVPRDRLRAVSLGTAGFVLGLSFGPAIQMCTVTQDTKKRNTLEQSNGTEKALQPFEMHSTYQSRIDAAPSPHPQPGPNPVNAVEVRSPSTEKAGSQCSNPHRSVPPMPPEPSLACKH